MLGISYLRRSGSALSFGISGNSRQKLATEITFFVVDQKWIKNPNCDNLALHRVSCRALRVMGAPSSHEVTGLLQAWGRGDEEALKKLVPVSVRAIARGCASSYGSRARRTHSPNHRTHPRDLSATGGCSQDQMAESSSFPSHLCAVDAPHTDRFRTIAPLPKTRKSRTGSGFR